jgi:hypothetical protein
MLPGWVVGYIGVLGSCDACAHVLWSTRMLRTYWSLPAVQHQPVAFNLYQPLLAEDPSIGISHSCPRYEQLRKRIGELQQRLLRSGEKPHARLCALLYGKRPFFTRVRCCPKMNLAKSAKQWMQRM